MIRILLAGLLALGLAGCHRGTVTVEAGGHHSHDHNCGHYWDGSGWLIVQRHAHRSGCGHYYHHNQWHAHPESHVYVHSSHGHFGVTIERSRVEESKPSNPPRAHDPKPQPPGHGSPPKPEPHKPRGPK
ncbi:MAG: hypothetical protein FD180_3303 [Planctomycetota bacterium]|nr:MAG: hypothetical protein FD180_3303 [Planctomycetota bacterium]